MKYHKHKNLHKNLPDAYIKKEVQFSKVTNWQSYCIVYSLAPIKILISRSVA